MSQWATWCSFEKAFLQLQTSLVLINFSHSLGQFLRVQKIIEFYVNIPTSKKEMQKETPRGEET
jgi:hypothetical protein